MLEVLNSWKSEPWAATFGRHWVDEISGRPFSTCCHRHPTRCAAQLALRNKARATSRNEGHVLPNSDQLCSKSPNSVRIRGGFDRNRAATGCPRPNPSQLRPNCGRRNRQQRPSWQVIRQMFVEFDKLWPGLDQLQPIFSIFRTRPELSPESAKFVPVSTKLGANSTRVDRI